MTVAIVLVTCGRLAYTRQTLETFSEQNPDARDQFLLLHADDHGADPEANAIKALAVAHGFETVVAHPATRGYRAARAEGIRIAADRGADWVVVLENDWEWVRPFPWALFEHIAAQRPHVYCLRLYGEFKERGHRMPCFRFHLGKNRQPVTWRVDPQAPERCELTRIHWGGPPSVTRMREMLILQADPLLAGYDARRDSQPEVTQSGRIDADVARVLDNVVYHIGHERTGRQTIVAPARRPVRYTPAWQATRQKYDEASGRCLDAAVGALGLPGSLLDAGCGTGAVVMRAVAQGIEAVGVDLSVPHAGPGAWRQADLRAPLDLGRSFDLVLCWEVAEHLPAEAAETLCASLARHLVPGGVLLFTAAPPGQKGDGHINEQPAAYWRERLSAVGLIFDAAQTATLATQWRAVAPRTPWYGANLQVWRAPGGGAIFRRPPVETLPTLAITMRTVDRSPKPNYVGGTLRRLVAQGVDPAAIHLCLTDPDTRWLDREIGNLAVTRHVPARRLTPNENGLAQIRVLDPACAEWVLLLEDDLAFCADFVGSTQRWLQRAARPDRHVYRLFSFRLRPAGRPAYDWPLKNMCGTQAVLLRMADAQDFLAWADANLETWGGFRGNAKIAFDKLMAAWALARWPTVPGVMSHPLFVQHIGDVSSIHPRAARMDGLFAGEAWRFASV